jgi:hypothetical protein
MKSRVRRSLALLLGAILACCLAPRPVRAGAYPVNACVSAKQNQVGNYCRRALKAWAAFESGQMAARRGAALQRAAASLAAKWGRADTVALARGTDCADTTLGVAAAQALVDAAVGTIVGEVNGGLDLGVRAQAACGAHLLEAAAAKCGSVLKAESKFIAAPATDPHRITLDRSLLAASVTFSAAWNKEIAAGCPTTAQLADVESAVDGNRSSIVTQTIISPNVDDMRFTEISPSGPIRYLGRSFTPTCVFGTPYHFFVKRGSVNKLLVYYEGGGACWEQLTCSVPVCNSTITSNDDPGNVTTGFADLSNPANPFRDWNVVFVGYCSCDVHFGDAARTYSNTDPMHPLSVQHRGYENSRVVEKWAREHFVDPDVVFVTGSSAGAYGAWFNAPLHEAVWPASRFHVLADAGNGVITQSFFNDFFPNWNFAANIPRTIPGLVDVLHNGTGIVGYTEIVANFFPETTWAHYATAFDGGLGGQTGFYNIMLNNNNPLAALTWWNGSCAFNDVMRMQVLETAAALPSNYRYYIGTGSRHTMWGSNKVYADTTGGVPPIVDWVNATLQSAPPTVAAAGWKNVECMNCGLTLPGDPVPNPLQPPFEQQGSDVVVVCPSSASGAFVGVKGR